MERPARRPAPTLTRRHDVPADLPATPRAGLGLRPRPHMPLLSMTAAVGPLAGRPPLPLRRPLLPAANLRRNVCPHFFMTGARGALPVHAPHLLKALSRQDSTISRCQLRGGVHLEQGYVSDVCLSARFNQCVFYEDELSRAE